MEQSPSARRRGDPSAPPGRAEREGKRGAGRVPVLTGRGRIWLSLSLVLLILGVGSGSSSLAALGLCVLSGLLALYVHFFPTAILVWRRYLELLWWVPRQAGAKGAQSSFGLVAHRPFPLKLTLRNLSPLALGLAEVRVFASRCVEVVGPAPLLLLPARSEVNASAELRVTQAGQWFLHGAAVQLRDRLGLFAVEAYVPSSTPLKVLPRQGPRAPLSPVRLSVGASDERLGVHTLRHRGIGGELRELRDYVPGDPFKLIAWKASARAPLGRLLVRDLDRETLFTHNLLLDIGPSMREGPPGSWKLDHAIELALSYARTVLDGGDRVGLLTYDGSIYGHLRPGAGPAQRLCLTEQLLSAMTVVDERFTGVSDAELAAAVARYLRQQEGLDVRVSRPTSLATAEAWSGLEVSPGGEYYDMQQLLQAVRRHLDREARSAAVINREARSAAVINREARSAAVINREARSAAVINREARSAADQSSVVVGPGADSLLLRQFCQRFGIELPYGRPSGNTGAILLRAGGLAAALERIAASRGSERVVLISDLEGILPGIPLIARAVSLCRRRGHQLLCLRPAARRYVPPELLGAPPAAAIAEIFGWEITRREAQAHSALARLGFHVIAVGPEDGLAQILGKG